MTEERKIHFTLEIEGRVQGVGFRYSAVQRAKDLGVTGFVRNLPSGNVYMEIEGDETEVLKMLRWCHSGPSMAKVQHVREFKDEVRGYNDFIVKY